MKFMFSLRIKILLWAMVLTGACLVLPTGGQASAQSSSDAFCATAPENGSAYEDPSQYWGIASGEIAHGMAGLRVYAKNAKTGQPINVAYELRSEMPAGNYQVPAGVNPHDRIFEWPVGKAGRDNQHWFRTGERLHFNPAPGASGAGAAGSCDGWSVLGPGNSDECPPPAQRSVPCKYPGGYYAQWGNGWVLDCEEWDSSANQFKRTNFWISNINNPNGERGYWTAKYTEQGRTSDIALNGKWQTTNGATSRIDLTWHPAQETPPNDSGECSLIRFLIPNDNQDGQGGNSNFSDYAIYVNDWGTPGHPAAAGSPDYQDGQVYGAPPGDPWVDYHGSATEPQHGGQHTEKNIRFDNKAVTGTLRYTVVIYDKFTNSNGNNVIKVRSRFTRVIDNCWQATCSIKIHQNVPGRGEGSNAVRAGESFDGVVTLRSTSGHNLPSAMITNAGNFSLTATTTWFDNPSTPGVELAPLPLGHNLDYPPAGSEGYIPLGNSFVAPNNVGSYTLTMYPDFWGRAGIGPACTATINVYKPYDLTALANTTMLPDNEDPDVVQHRGTIGPNNPSANVPYSASSTLNGVTTNAVNTTGNTTINYAYNHTNFSSLAAGDRYCTHISTPNGTGWAGPGNDTVRFDNPRSSSACETVHNRPYLRVYGADVMAGNVCGGGAGNDINAYVSPKSTKTGSGGQLGVFALGSIDGFISASLRYALAQPQPKKGLTFANTGAGSGEYGGNFGAGLCPTDYFAGRDDNSPNLPSSGSLAGIRNSSGKYNATGPITLTGGGSQTGQKAVYVQGDVYISSNITYLGGGYSSIEGLPRFTLIASGNIYIAPGVSTLDGTYIAGGKISTCATSSASYSTAQLWDICRGNRLTINGAFIAPEVDFLRSRGSLRQSLRNSDGTTRTNAAEIFVYSPEVYLAPLIGGSGGGAGGSEIYQPKSYDAITTLPPIL